MIVRDNGSELPRDAFLTWTDVVKVQGHYRAPGKLE